MDIVLEKIEAYKKSIAKIDKNREAWSNTTKQLIFETLKNVKNASDLLWHVQKVEGLTNHEAVNISFNNQSSGFIEKTSTKIRNYVKHGGALIFAQAYNGQIFIIYEYPYIEDWVSQLDSKLVDKVDPQEITKDFILTQVSNFLEEMSNWESSTAAITRNQIGYKVER